MALPRTDQYNMDAEQTGRTRSIGIGRRAVWWCGQPGCHALNRTTPGSGPNLCLTYGGPCELVSPKHISIESTMRFVVNVPVDRVVPWILL